MPAPHSSSAPTPLNPHSAMPARALPSMLSPDGHRGLPIPICRRVLAAKHPLFPNDVQAGTMPAHAARITFDQVLQGAPS